MNNYLKREKEILDSIPPSRDEQVKKWLDSIKDKDMDYEKKYNKALAIARDFYNSTEYAKSHAEIKATYEAIFPELCESSDEKIKKEISDFISYSKVLDETKKRWLDWLEKQKHAEWSEVDNVRLEEAIQMVESNGGWIRSDDAVKLVSDWLKSLKDRALPQPKQEWSRDNNPKFKEGDWIVSDEANKDYRICKIITIKEGEYTIESIYGYKGHNVFKVFDNIYKKWTIQDAKDGDVLQLGMCTVIFKKLLDLNAWCYCSYTEKDGFDAVTDNDHIYGTGNASPATKEQRDLLFAKMKEEGYEWDAEKKQLRKISIRRFKEGDTIKPQTEQFSFSGDINEGMYDENGWMELHDGIKMDRQGHIAGGLKLK